METQSKQSVDVYSIVTDKIIEQLEKGTVPWRKPWTITGIPRNLISKRPYRGINVMLLATLGYRDNLFLTYRQLKALGGSVNQDEKPHLVVFLSYDEKKPDGEESQTDGDKKKAHLRYYKVYNIAQCSGLPENMLPVPVDGAVPLPECEDIIAGMPDKPEIVYKDDDAYYSVQHDFINMPEEERFESSESYYATLFHELVHSTGHHSRLNRKNLTEMAEYGNSQYSHEELVAEIGTCYLLSHVGITDQFEQSAAYIQGWLAQLKNDKRFIYSAASHAQRATDFILNVKAEQNADSEDEG